jgi:hypothetical protein
VAIENYATGSALRHTATEARTAKSEFIIQNEQQRGAGVDRDEVLVAVDFQHDLL